MTIGEPKPVQHAHVQVSAEYFALDDDEAADQDEAIADAMLEQFGITDGE